MRRNRSVVGWRGPTLDAVFDARLNGLNLLRLLLAIGVILWHSYQLSGTPVGWAPAQRLMLGGFVDAFFAISGFLIVRSWVQHPSMGRYLRARFLRIFPGFWVSLVAVAFIAAPIGAAMQGVRLTPTFVRGEFGYVGHNLALWIFQTTIAGTPSAGVWNGSTWTLSWEFACYVGVLVLGLTGLLLRRHLLPILFGAAWAVLFLTDLSIGDVWQVRHAARFALMFLAGALVYLFRDRIPARWSLVVACLVIVVLSAYLPDYRLIGALPLAYACITAGALIRVSALRLRTDLSYGTYVYAYPVQVLLLGAGVAAHGIPLYFLASLACTLPVAALSWLLVERPAQGLGKREAKHEVVSSGAVAVADVRGAVDTTAP